jgi:hypothetical protein
MVLGWLGGKGKAPAHTRSLTAIDELAQSVYYYVHREYHTDMRQFRMP